jgi:hypothetical protein
MEMKHRPLFDLRHKDFPPLIDETKGEIILELDKLEGMFIRLRNLSILGKERTKISDREKRAKMEGYVQAFAHAVELVSKEKKKIQGKHLKKRKICPDEMKRIIPFIDRIR